MTAGRLIFPGQMPCVDTNGDAIPGAKAYFYTNGTTTLANTYTAVGLITANSNPVVADGVGVWPQMWADTATIFTVGLTDSDGVPLPHGTWTGLSAAIDAALASASLAESAQAAAEAAEAAAAASAASAAAVEAEFGDVAAAITAASASATAAASSATAAAASAAAAATFNPSSYTPVSRTITAAGLATGGGDLSANRTITVTAAAASDVKAGTSTGVAVTPAALMGSSAHFALTDASTVAWDVRSGYNASLTLTGDAHTIGAPTNLSDGQFISLDINSGAGSFTLSWNAVWDFGLSGLPTMPTGASKVLTVTGKYNSTTAKIRASASQPA